MPRNPKAERARQDGKVKPVTMWDCRCKSCGSQFTYTAKTEPRFCISCRKGPLEFKAHIPQPGAGFYFKFEGDTFGVDPLRLFMDVLEQALNFGRQFHPPDPPRHQADGMTRHEAALFIATYSCMPKDYILDSNEAMQQAYKRAAQRLHPDKGGSHDLFVKLQHAKQVLESRT